MKLTWFGAVNSALAMYLGELNATAISLPTFEYDKKNEQ